ncbi:MAG: tRNA (adenosine(37)-N6)-dimethylallyltransferase MiaA [Bryobacteraceae bacterium]
MNVDPCSLPSPLIVVAGPTGSGKSHLALALAREFDGEIVNADSVQVYKYFDIGSAKLSEGERHGIPHHLLDVASPDEVFTAGDYARAARQALTGINARAHLPIVAGGTGFYIRALLEGLFEGPPRDEALRTRMAAREQRQPGSLHRWLARFDPLAAGRIHAHDVNKTMRALEVLLRTGRPVSELHAGGRDALTGYRRLMLVLNPPREQLYERIEARSAAMFDRGLVEETQSILARGYARTCKPFESLGYAQALGVIEGRMSREQAVAETAMLTRRYAKRQWTWFRKERDAVWLDSFGENAVHPGIALVRHWLRG